MLRRVVRSWPWLVVGLLVAMALARYGVTREALRAFLPQLWLYAKGMGLVVLLFVAALGFGWPVLRRLVPVEGQAGAPLFAAALGLGAISLATLLIGVLGGLYPLAAWAILGVGVGLAAFQARGWLAWARSVSWRPVLGERPTWAPFPTFLIVAAAVCILYALTTNGLTPPLWWDEAAYHLALPKLYVEAHRIFNVPFIIYSNQPFNSEMLFTLALLFRSEVMASLVSLALALLLTAGLWLFGVESFGRRPAFLAVVLFWVTPAVFRLAGTAHVELALATYAFLSLWAFWRWHATGGTARGWLALAAVLAGLAAGTKLTGALIGLIVVALVIFCGLRRRRPVMIVAGQVFLVGGVALALVLPWYVKSYAYTGNPVWPFLNFLFGGRYWDALGDEYHHAYLTMTNLPLTLTSFFTAPWHLGVEPIKFGSFPLGLLLLVLAPLALLFRPHHGKPVLFLAAVTGLFYLAWFFMTHQTRFLMPVVPAMCLLGSYALHHLLARPGRGFRWALQGSIVGLILLEMPGIAPDLTTQWTLRLPYLIGAESRAGLLTRYSDVTAAYLWANDNLPADSLVLLMPFENRGYFLDRPYLWANPVSQRILKLEQFGNAEALWHDLKSRGVTHLLDNPNAVIDVIRDWPRIRQLLDELKAGYADPIYERNGVTIYRLR
jgi:4-amino-4-deoxy-L-arabinose transferase-like glycosyltransferase